MALLQREHLIYYRMYLIKRVEKGQLSAISARKYLRAPIRWVEWMQTCHGRLRSLDLSGITILGGVTKPRLVPTHAEISIFLDGVRKTSIRHIAANVCFTLLVATGARPTEIADLTFARVNEESQSIMLQSKGGPFRWLYLPTEVWVMIQKYITEVHGRLRNPNQVILLKRSGAPISYKWIWKRYLRALDYCGMRFDGMMAFRHRFATDCLEAGLDHNATRYLLGHQDASHLSRYQHAEKNLISKSINSAFQGFNWEGKQ